jgi:hypothetical protein
VFLLPLLILILILFPALKTQMLFSLTLTLSRWEREPVRPPLVPASLSWLLKGLPSARDGLRRSFSQREKAGMRENGHPYS